MHDGHLIKVILITLFLPIASLLVAANINYGSETSEFNANVFSSLLALACWGIAGFLFFIRSIGKRLFFTLTAFIILRIIINFLHFYVVLAPSAGIESSSEFFPDQNLGDWPYIYQSAIGFTQIREESGIIFAIFGDYERGINNPGVSIINGVLFCVFGAYGTVQIPWSVIFSAFAALLIGLIGISIRLPKRLCRNVVLLVFFMPGFFVLPCMYRDNFIIFLLALSAYTAILIPHRNLIVLSIALFVESVLLFSLRAVYVLLPATFSLLSIKWNSIPNNKLTKYIFFSSALLVVFTLAVSEKTLFVGGHDFSSRFLAGMDVGQRSFTILEPFKQFGPFVFFPAAAVFSLLAPMPWWQPVSPILLSYQIFSYLQTWYALTALVALFYSYKRKLIPTEASILVVFSLVIFLLALLGSYNFGAGYLQIALPFVFLASIRYLSANWVKCFEISTAIVALVHIVLLVL